MVIDRRRSELHFSIVLEYLCPRKGEVFSLVVPIYNNISGHPSEDGLSNCYIVTLLHCYIVTLLHCQTLYMCIAYVQEVWGGWVGKLT